MAGPSQPAITKLAKDAFEIAVADVPEKRAERERQALAAASRTGNIATYPDVLVRLAGERVTEMFLVGVDAYLDVFSTLELPADAQTERFFEAVALQIASGATSWVHGQLDLYRMRTKNPVNDPGGHLNRTVQRGMSSAQKKAKFRTEQQRIKAKLRTHKPESINPLESEDGAKAGFWLRMEARFRVLQRDDGPFAQWSATSYNEAGDQWYIGGADQNAREKFRWAAERVAVELGQPAGRAAVFFWLNLMKRDSPDYRSYPGGVGADRGKIKRVCEASADYCLKLEAKAVASKIPTKLPEREEGTGLEEPGYLAIEHADWRKDEARARRPPILLRPVRSARLTAMAALHQEATATIQSSWPPTKQRVEQCLWLYFFKYADDVFDKAAEARLGAKRSAGRLGQYSRWLRSKCLPVVVDDVCRPILGQFPITVRHVVETIGGRESAEIESTRRALWGMLTEVLGGPFTENLRNGLSANLEARSTHWEAQFEDAPIATVADVSGQRGNAKSRRAHKAQRNQLLTEAQTRWRTIAGRKIPFVWAHKAAGVDHKDAYDWKNGKLPAKSIMSANIERVLKSARPPMNPNPSHD